MTPVGDTLTARIALAPQWDPSGKTVFVAAALPTRRASAVSRAIGQEHRRAHSRRSVLHRYGHVEARLDRCVRWHDGRADAAARSCCARSSCRQVDSTSLYVAPSPETLGVIGKEQNDTFVLRGAAAGQAATPARKLTERGRFSWAADGERLAFVRGGRLMVMPVDGGEAKPWLECLEALDRRTGVGARSQAICDARRRSVGDRPGGRARPSRECIRRRSRSWICISSRQMARRRTSPLASPIR